MEDAHILAAFPQHVGPQYIGVFHTLIFHEVGEAFTLHTCHIQDVGFADAVFRKLCFFHVADAFLLAVQLVLLGHFEFFRSHEVKGRIILAHRHQQRMHRTPIFQVTHQEDVQVVKPSLRLPNGVEVEHGL